MKKFKFRLQAVLEAREKELEDKQLEMAKVQNKLTQQTKKLNHLYQYLEETKEALEFMLDSGTIDLIQVNNSQNFILKLQDDIKNQHKIIADIEVELEEKKKEVLEALKAKTMLEKLKEKNYKAFMAEIDRKEFIEIDEIATNRHGKNI